MKKEDLLALFKFYKGEKSNPYIGKDSMKAKWWEGEKAMITIAIDNRKWQFIANSLKEAIRNNEVSGALIDSSIPIEKRIIIYFLDLWHGKWYPYDSLDDIFDYVKA